MRISGLLVALVLSRDAMAEPSVISSVASERVPQNVFYVEAFGKGGAYGVGYERAMTSKLSLGVLGSVVAIRGQDIATAASYLHAKIFRRGRNVLFGELGAVLVYSKIESPVKSWSGMSDTGGGGVVGLGWERIGNKLIVRTQASLMAGDGGVAPWGGIAIGFAP